MLWYSWLITYEKSDRRDITPEDRKRIPVGLYCEEPVFFWCLLLRIRRMIVMVLYLKKCKDISKEISLHLTPLY